MRTWQILAALQLEPREECLPSFSSSLALHVALEIDGSVSTLHFV